MLTTPVVLMSSECSGAGLLSRMLDAHPLVCSPPPAGLVELLTGNLPRYGDPADAAGWNRLLTDTADLLATCVSPWRTIWTVERLHREVHPRTPGALIRHVHLEELRARGKQRLFLNERRAHRFLPLLQRTFPGLKVVWLVRDPRDTALAWKESPVLRGDVVRAAAVWREDQRRGLEVLGCLLPGRDLHLLTYEQLLNDPWGELRALCGFLELPPDPAMLEPHYRRRADADVRTDGLWRSVSRPVIAGDLRRYRLELERDEIAYVETFCEAEMRALGYTPEVADHERVGELRASLLPRERRDKPGWERIPEPERRLRLARADVVRRMAAAPVDTGWLRRRSCVPTGPVRKERSRA